MWRSRIVVAVVVAGVILSGLYLFWRENERRYAALALSGCFGDTTSTPLAAPQECSGARRLCREAPPLLDWRHYCD